MYRSSASNRLKEEEETSKGDEMLQKLVTQETNSTILLNEADTELKRRISKNAQTSAELVNAKREENEVSSRISILRSRESELLSLKQTHAAAKTFKEALECVNELNENVLPQVKQLNDTLEEKKMQVKHLEDILAESEASVQEAKENQREADLTYVKNRKLRLEAELNRRTDENDLGSESIASHIEVAHVEKNVKKM